MVDYFVYLSIVKTRKTIHRTAIDISNLGNLFVSEKTKEANILTHWTDNIAFRITEIK